jgi:cell division protein FtsL
MTPPAAAAPAVRARTAFPSRPLTTAPRPRRVSGPARRKPSAPARRHAEESAGLVVGLIEASRRVSGHRLLDRLIRGRSWIVLVAFALIGIVTLQLGLLKLNAGIGRSLESSALLQRENAALSIENAELAAGNRVEATAAHLGMQLVSPGALRFLSVHPRADVAHASSVLKAPLQSSSSSVTPAQSATSNESTSGESSTAPASSATTATEESSSSESSPAPAPATTGEASSAGSGATPSGGESAPSSAPVTAPTASSPSSQATPAGGTQAESGG